MLNDYSQRQRHDRRRAGASSRVKDLKGKKIGVELNFVDHLLLLKALEANGMSETDVELVNVPTNDTPQALASGGVDAIAAWQPNSGQALQAGRRLHAVFTSKDVPGLIYDGLYVSRESLAARRDDWQKVVKVWFKVVEVHQRPRRPGRSAQDHGGPREADARGVRQADGRHVPARPAGEPQGTSTKGDGLDSVYGSSTIVDEFNVKGVYKESQHVRRTSTPAS